MKSIFLLACITLLFSACEEVENKDVFETPNIFSEEIIGGDGDLIPDEDENEDFPTTFVASIDDEDFGYTSAEAVLSQNALTIVFNDLNGVNITLNIVDPSTGIYTVEGTENLFTAAVTVNGAENTTTFLPNLSSGILELVFENGVVSSTLFEFFALSQGDEVVVTNGVFANIPVTLL